MISPLTQELINALQILPGVGPKGAQRMAFGLLKNQRQSAQQLGNILLQTMQQIQYCQTCRNFTEATICQLCSQTKRNQQLLCIVESPSDVIAIEQTSTYQGHYFVLHGRLSPLDGIGPEQLGISQLKNKINASNEISEIIIATNPTVEGEATAHYIAELVKPMQIQCSRLAHGVPMGGELEYLDNTTVAKAFAARVHLKQPSTISEQICE